MKFSKQHYCLLSYITFEFWPIGLHIGEVIDRRVRELLQPLRIFNFCASSAVLARTFLKVIRPCADVLSTKRRKWRPLADNSKGCGDRQTDSVKKFSIPSG